MNLNFEQNKFISDYYQNDWRYVLNKIATRTEIINGKT
jgi:hypothetical protein